ncbi:MAG: GNAT family N-acetyltransferase [Methanobacteriota archaeon]
MIRKTSISDLDAVAELHHKSLDNSFLTLLGVDFLKVLHEGFVESDSTQTFVYCEDGVVRGLICGTNHPEGFLKKIFFPKLARFSKIIFAKSLTNPKILMSCFETLLYSKKTDILEDAELLVIVVDEDFRGKGVGSKLLTRLLTEFSHKKTRKVKVIVDESNIYANRFYGKMGFNIEKSVKLYGKKMNVYSRTLT